MISSVSHVKAPSFQALITWETKEGNKSKSGQIVSTPDQDRAIKSHLNVNLGIKSAGKKLPIRIVNSEDPDFKKLIELMQLRDVVIPADTNCRIEEVRPAITKGAKPQSRRNIQIIVSRLTSFFIDFSQINKGVLSIPELRRGLRP